MKKPEEVPPASSWVELQGANFFGLQTFLALGDLELDALAFGQAAEAVGLDGGVMDENVLTALALNKTKTLGIVKPLHCSLFHLLNTLLFLLKLRRIEADVTAGRNCVSGENLLNVRI
jgi:hypothetical protein